VEPFLPPAPPLPPGQDYASLLREGIEHLQSLSGRVWTDYNAHDPGVTLLEALCYTLTDVSRRAALPIPTLLARPAGPAAGPVGLLVPAREAFANHPVTLHDYRQLLLGRLPTLVRDAWLSLPPDGQPWHYQVQVALHAPPLGAPARTEAELAEVHHQVLHLLHAHRNLGELFASVQLLRPYPVVVGGHLELAEGHQPTKALAALLQRLSHWIAPAPASVAAQWGSVGQPPEDRFAGPIAENRLFDVSTFGPQRLRIDSAELGLAAQRTTGAKGLTTITLRHTSSTSAPANSLEVPVGHVAVLDVEASLRHFTTGQRGHAVPFEPSLVLWTYHQPPLPIDPDRSVTPAAPATAHYADLGHYDPVQSLLPPLYGTGEEGPPAHSPPLRRAHIMQLKGYLLLFDQLLANFCAQLENVGHFFSVVAQTTTTYTLPLYHVPYVAPLLPGTGISPDEAWRGDGPTAAHWRAYQQQPHNPYRRALRDLAEPLAAQQHRRGTFLAHLLARFGYSAQQPSAGAGGLATDEPARIAGYEHLLTHLQKATYHRGAARTAAHGYAESGLEFFLFLLTGLETLPRKWARQQPLTTLESQVQVGSHHLHEAVPRLRVRGTWPEVPENEPDFLVLFEEVLTLLALQDQSFTLEELTSSRVRLPGRNASFHWELELLEEIVPNAAPPAPVAQRVRAYHRQLDAQLERFTILDHLVLKPLDEAAEWPRLADDFFHFQATALLPGYALRFGQAADGGPTASRTFIENLVQQHAPAHLLVNILWLDYPAMRQWEEIFAALAAASPLLNPEGQAHPTALAGAQHRARRFLAQHLYATQ